MKTRILLTGTLSVLLLAPAGAASGGATSPVRFLPPAGAVISDNVEYLGTIPDTPGVGGRMVKVGDQLRFYVTGVKGLTIYDVTNPALPIPMGALPLPHFQNEDVDVSDDGSKVIISTDTATLDGGGNRSNGIRIIDTSDPASPRQVGLVAQSNHTAMCADPACEWIYGSSGNIYDARDPANVAATGVRWKPTGGSAHALNRDASGLLISDSNPRFVLDPSESPESPEVIAQGRPTGSDGYLQHNNVRPVADLWEPRPLPEEGEEEAPELPLRPGELLVGNSESNVTVADGEGFCPSYAGGLSTWSMVNFDRGEEMEQLDVFRPVNGEYVGGDPAVNALGCSGHWFTWNDGIVAASWYEHGVKFFDVDSETGEIDQVGFFQPVATEAGAAHWVTDADGNEYVYSVDYARGIDILRFHRDEPAPSERELYESWAWNLRNLRARGFGSLASAERFACSFAMRGGLTVG